MTQNAEMLKMDFVMCTCTCMSSYSTNWPVCDYWSL